MDDFIELTWVGSGERVCCRKSTVARWTTTKKKTGRLVWFTSGDTMTAVESYDWIKDQMTGEISTLKPPGAMSPVETFNDAMPGKLRVGRGHEVSWAQGEFR